MIWLYTGTPGSGKSYHVAVKICDILRYTSKPIIANFPINCDQVQALPFPFLRKIFKPKPLKGRFIYCENRRLKPQLLKRYSRMFLPKFKESQALLIIDECSIMFNCRNWQVGNRDEWIQFFQQHRKLGYDIILITQYDRMIDRQIRGFIEYEVKHRNAKNFKFIGWLMGVFFGGNCFVSIEYWYECKERIRAHFSRFNRSIAKIYDTYQIFE